MITHIVLIRLKDRSAGASAFVKTRLLSLGPLDGLVSLEVNVGDGGDARHFDLVQIARFTSKEALIAYATDPAHLAIQGDVRPHIAETAKIDYFEVVP